MTMSKAILAAMLLASSAAHAAGPVYRCGNTYSQTPCPSGQLIDATDPRSAAQRAEAARVAARERRYAAELERERKASAAAAAKAGPTVFNASARASGPKPGKPSGKPKRQVIRRVVPLGA